MDLSGFARFDETGPEIEALPGRLTGAGAKEQARDSQTLPRGRTERLPP